MISCLNGADHVTNQELIRLISCTDDVPQEAITKELNRHESRNQQAIIMTSAVMNHAAQLAIIKQLNRKESDGSAGHCQADEQAGIMQLSWQL